MIDYMKAHINLPENDIPDNVWNGVLEPFNWKGLDFFPKDFKTFCATSESKRRMDLGNLYITVGGGQTASMTISNSLHKLWNGGYNHNDFTKEQLLFTTEYLSEALMIDFAKAKLVGRFEFAVNLKVENPKQFYSSQARFRDALPSLMVGDKKRYGTQFILNSYRVKTYAPIEKLIISGANNKGFDNDIIRYELVSTPHYLRKRKIPIDTIRDLCDDNVLRRLGNILVETANQIEYESILPEGTEYKDMQKHYFFKSASSTEIKSFRKESPKTFSRHKKRYKELCNQNSNSSFDLGQAINEKWELLMTS